MSVRGSQSLSPDVEASQSRVPHLQQSPDAHPCVVATACTTPLRQPKLSDSIISTRHSTLGTQAQRVLVFSNLDAQTQWSDGQYAGPSSKLSTDYDQAAHFLTNPCRTLSCSCHLPLLTTDHLTQRFYAIGPHLHPSRLSHSAKARSDHTLCRWAVS